MTFNTVLVPYVDEPVTQDEYDNMQDYQRWKRWNMHRRGL